MGHRLYPWFISENLRLSAFICGFCFFINAEEIMSYTLFRNGTLIDGNGGAPVLDAAVLVKDNLIVEVGAAVEVTVPEGDVTVIDALGGTILPGFIDTHVHIMIEGVNMAKMMTEPFSLKFYQAARHMRNTIDAGITSVRDAGGADLGVKTAVEQGLIVGPRMQISITALSITGGHGDGWMASGASFDLMPPYPGMPDRHLRRRGGSAQEGARGAARGGRGGQDLFHRRRAQPHRPS